MYNESDWPVLKSYTAESLSKIAMPMGGIGTGTLSLGGRGNLKDWAIMNRPAIGYTPRFLQGMRHVAPFFAIRVADNTNVHGAILEGPIDDNLVEASEGSREPNHGFPRFEKVTFDTAYPMARLSFESSTIPIQTRLYAFNPLVPGDIQISSLPGCYLTYAITNRSNNPIEVSVCGTIINIIGEDGSKTKQFGPAEFVYKGAKKNVNVFQNQGDIAGIECLSNGVPNHSDTWGSLALMTTDTDGISYRTGWETQNWGDSTLDFWDDFLADGHLDNRKSTNPHNRMASLVVKKTIQPGETGWFNFVLAWYFPNRRSWNDATILLTGKEKGLLPLGLKNFYTTQYKNAWDAGKKLIELQTTAYTRTQRFVSSFIQTSIPEVIKEAALFNLSTLRSQTVFRTQDGHFFGWEGIHSSVGSCFGSCTHVWNYESATPFLFGEIARSMRTVEFLHATNSQGKMGFRVFLPLFLNKFRNHYAAADGQMGTIVKLYREWQLSGDDHFLLSLWPKAKKALEFAWKKGGWDEDQDGVMEGCQHNTMDIEYYGPNPQMQFWYLAALKAASLMAQYVKDEEFSNKSSNLFDQGVAFTVSQLFNGQYFEQIITPSKRPRSGLRAGMGSSSYSDPSFQLGSGCLIDQLIGQLIASLASLPNMIDEEIIRKTLVSVYENNVKTSFYNHFNHMRTYVFNDEVAVLMATYPKGNRPKQPFPYCNEVMTGFEHSLAAHLILVEEQEKALNIITAIRSRYDGKKRNPFSEAECGHHYARAMAAWSSFLAWTGFSYSAVTKEFRCKPSPSATFWSNGNAWGTFRLSEHKKSLEITLEFGVLELMLVKVHEVGVWQQSPAVHITDRTPHLFDLT